MSEKIFNISAFEEEYCIRCPRIYDSEEKKRCIANRILELIEKEDDDF